MVEHYGRWLGLNCTCSPLLRQLGGMGGMPPMLTTAVAKPRISARGTDLINNSSTSRTDKQVSGYSDNANLINDLFLNTTEDYYLGESR